jgi:hypothetical protein
LFDIVNVEFEGPELADVLVYYSGGRPDLFLLLVRTLFVGLSSRHSLLRPADLTRAWLLPSFRESAVAELLKPVEAVPFDQASLGAVLWACSQPGGEVTLEEIRYAFEMISGVQSSEARVRESLDHLVGTALIEGGPPPAHYRTPHSGIGDLLLDAIPNPEAYVQGALERAG